VRNFFALINEFERFFEEGFDDRESSWSEYIKRLQVELGSALHNLNQAN
jgi:hypothetical protein